MTPSPNPSSEEQLRHILEGVWHSRSIDDVVPELLALIDAARIDENQRRLDKIIAWENRKPVPGELTSASFGSAGAGMEVAGFKRSFEERIAELKPPTAEQPE